MIKALTNGSVRLVNRYLPDAFIFAVILTFVVFVFGLGLGNSPIQMVQFWGEGFWNLLAFSMQMVLILVTGHTLANSPLFKKGLAAVASMATTPGTAIILTSLVSAIASWINWGFGLVIGALLAREVAQRVKDVDYRLLVASAYSGFIIWHAGFSGSIPLTIATDGHFSQDLIGIIPTSDTIFAPFNLIIVFAVLIALPLVNRLMMPDRNHTISFNQFGTDQELAAVSEPSGNDTPADKLENSKLITLLTSILGFAFIVYYFVNSGFELNLNIVIFIFLILGIFLHKTPRQFLNAVNNAVKGTSGIIVQFPFYAGIMGMMVASGLAGSISEWFVSIATTETFPVLAFLSAGIVNVFVPSGGGQWAVQAPIMLPAGLELGVDTTKTVMAVAWGDAWTNLIQPFWALPALAIAGLGARDIMGYCLIMLFVTGALISLGLFIL
ncbi:short-chain fatty acid transporter [Anaerobacillus sp. MEB173]|uniref:short-chain fatty acid transporter n=1 Tax=Anaerobacillus sp. MEB173 TaxID=3383345 RepID=UPI003F8F20A0